MTFFTLPFNTDFSIFYNFGIDSSGYYEEIVIKRYTSQIGYIRRYAKELDYAIVTYTEDQFRYVVNIQATTTTNDNDILEVYNEIKLRFSDYVLSFIGFIKIVSQ